jgi:hypothetical protein
MYDLYSLFKLISMTKEIFFSLSIYKQIFLYRSQTKVSIGITVSEILIYAFYTFCFTGYPNQSGAYVFRPLISTPQPVSITRNM